MYFFIFMIGAVLASASTEYGSDELLKAAAKQKITNEFLLVNPFWTNTMIPVAVCLAVMLLLVSIFAVSLIAIKALNDPEPSFSTFSPPGFDALWERNVQAELGMNSNNLNKQNVNDPPSKLKSIMVDSSFVSQARIVPIVITDLKQKMIVDKSNSAYVPLEAPKPVLADNSRTGIEPTIY